MSGYTYNHAYNLPSESEGTIFGGDETTMY
jgi:hypothetical protein